MKRLIIDNTSDRSHTQQAYDKINEIVDFINTVEKTSESIMDEEEKKELELNLPPGWKKYNREEDLTEPVLTIKDETGYNHSITPIVDIDLFKQPKELIAWAKDEDGEWRGFTDIPEIDQDCNFWAAYNAYNGANERELLK